MNEKLIPEEIEESWATVFVSPLTGKGNLNLLDYQQEFLNQITASLMIPHKLIWPNTEAPIGRYAYIKFNLPPPANEVEEATMNDARFEEFAAEHNNWNDIVAAMQKDSYDALAELETQKELLTNGIFEERFIASLLITKRQQSASCPHEWVDVSFTSGKKACKHCDCDKPC